MAKTTRRSASGADDRAPGPAPDALSRHASTQHARVLAMLRRAGHRGITQLDADALPKPIRRLASRVHDLRAIGYTIETRARRQMMAVYVLVGEPSPPPPLAPPGADQPELFDRAIGAPPPACAIGDWEPEP
jgi:hypothetical protein